MALLHERTLRCRVTDTVVNVNQVRNHSRVFVGILTDTSGGACAPPARGPCASCGRRRAPARGRRRSSIPTYTLLRLRCTCPSVSPSTSAAGRWHRSHSMLGSLTPAGGPPVHHTVCVYELPAALPSVFGDKGEEEGEEGKDEGGRLRWVLYRERSASGSG